MAGDADRERPDCSAMSERTVMMVRSLEDSLAHDRLTTRSLAHGVWAGDEKRYEVAVIDEDAVTGRGRRELRGKRDA